MNRFSKIVLLPVCLLSCLWLGGSPANAQQSTFTITRVSVATGGGEANNESALHDISGNGRYIVFVSYADNLVPNDTNGADDIFLHDRETGQTERVSVASDESEANGNSTSPAISADGRYVAFSSMAFNLIPNDPFGGSKIFLRDRLLGKTTLISVNSNGEQADRISYAPAISPDGTYVAFVSNATNLDARTNNQFRDHIYLHSRLTGETSLLTVNSLGEAADDRSGNFLGGGIAVSNGGTYVAFVSTATNLVDNDTNGKRDIFLYRRNSATVQRISHGRNGAESNGDALSVRMSDDGTRILFDSLADNLVADDTNAQADLFLYHRESKQVTLVSKALAGGVGEGADGDISGDGRFVAYSSNTGSHVANDCSPGQNCVYRYDAERDETILLSANKEGGPAGNHSQEARIAGDGHSIVFQSLWDGFVNNDTNEYPDLFLYKAGDTGTPVVRAHFVADVRPAPDGRLVLPWAAEGDMPVTVALEQAQPITVTVTVRVTDAAENFVDYPLLFPANVTQQHVLIPNPHAAAVTTYHVQLLTALEESHMYGTVSAVGMGGAFDSALNENSGSHHNRALYFALNENQGFWRDENPGSHHNRALGDFFAAFWGGSAEEEGEVITDCYMHSLCILMRIAGWHGESCPLDFLPFVQVAGQSSPVATAPMLETLYTTRDSVMATSPSGRYYVQLYYGHTSELTNILLHNPTVLWATWDGINSWLPALNALNSNNGGDVTITATMITELETVLHLLSSAGSPELQATIAQQRTQLNLAGFIGLTMNQAWSAIEQQPVYDIYLPLVQR